MDRAERFFLGLTLAGAVCLAASFTLWVMTTSPHKPFKHFIAATAPVSIPAGGALETYTQALGML